jgi:hypothetical protein
VLGLLHGGAAAFLYGEVLAKHTGRLFGERVSARSKTDKEKPKLPVLAIRMSPACVVQLTERSDCKKCDAVPFRREQDESSEQVSTFFRHDKTAFDLLGQTSDGRWLLVKTGRHRQAWVARANVTGCSCAQQRLVIELRIKRPKTAEAYPWGPLNASREHTVDGAVSRPA